MASLESKPAERADTPIEASFPTLHLDESQVNALGLTADDMGKSMGFAANVKLVSLSLGEFKSATLEIQDAEVEKGSSEEDKATKIFDAGETLI